MRLMSVLLPVGFIGTPVLLCSGLIYGCTPEGEGTPVGVTLDDGHVLVGSVQTETLQLEGGLGIVDVPLDDIGLVLPVEGRTLSDANDHVTVWLRNGSELRGKWLDPAVAMGIAVGGETVTVDLPAEDLQALQLRGGEQWPEGELYRVKTLHGDDFLVDATRTRIVMTNELGTFRPFLDEARTIEPLGDPLEDWRIELDNGTVLIGPLADAEVTFALPMGPQEVTVPLELFASMQREYWAPKPSMVQRAAETVSDGSYGRYRGDKPASPAPKAEKKQLARPGLSSSQGWFDHRNLEDAKR